jgi:hypothetical protein
MNFSFSMLQPVAWEKVAEVVEVHVDSTVKSKLMNVAITQDKTQYPTPIEVLKSLLPVKCSQTWSVLNFLKSSHPGRQIERLLSVGVLTGYSVTRSVSAITNMTVREQNLEFSI